MKMPRVREQERKKGEKKREQEKRKKEIITGGEFNPHPIPIICRKFNR